MTELITQRTDYDCTVCCLAMMLGLSYETVGAAIPGYHAEIERTGTSKGINDDQVQSFLKRCGVRSRVLRAMVLGGRSRQINSDRFKPMLWGRQAIIDLPSLNLPGGFHSAYFDGRDLHDPSPGDRYSWKTAIVLSAMVVEHGRILMGLAPIDVVEGPRKPGFWAIPWGKRRLENWRHARGR